MHFNRLLRCVKTVLMNFNESRCLVIYLRLFFHLMITSFFFSFLICGFNEFLSLNV